jgi:hypothetical protein
LTNFRTKTQVGIAPERKYFDGFEKYDLARTSEYYFGFTCGELAPFDKFTFRGKFG